MKRFATALIAAATFVAPLALPTQAAAQYRGDRGDRGDRDWDDDDGDRDRDWDRDRDGDRRGWRRDRRHDRGRHRGWDRSRYNGYSYRSRWYYGPPPEAYYGDVDYGWRSWRRGDRLPSYYRNSYRRVDYRDYHMRPPPRGYHYVRDDRGDILLVAIATGIILSVILNN